MTTNAIESMSVASEEELNLVEGGGIGAWLYDIGYAVGEGVKAYLAWCGDNPVACNAQMS
jgi:hypothetical protein